jgi:hypothetical protein
MKFLKIPNQRLGLPANQKVLVTSFFISSYPVTAAQYALYSKQTGATTLAEEQKNEFTPYKNSSFDNVPLEGWFEIPAYNISFAEAEAFCMYISGALPTEQQWMAFVQYVCKAKLFTASMKARTEDQSRFAIHFAGDEWVRSSHKNSAFCVGRPPQIRIPGIRSPVVKPEGCVTPTDVSVSDPSITFRVVLNTNPSSLRLVRRAAGPPLARLL